MQGKSPAINVMPDPYRTSPASFRRITVDQFPISLMNLALTSRISSSVKSGPSSLTASSSESLSESYLK